MLDYCQLDPREQISMKTIFVQENTIENEFCKLSAILSRPQCVIARSQTIAIHHVHVNVHLVTQTQILSKVEKFRHGNTPKIFELTE